MIVYLGTHHPGWIERVDVPLFVSHRRLLGGENPRKTLPRALGPVAIDSGGFTEISMYGEWRTSETDYLAAVRRYVEEIGIDFAAPQDWMCEPIMLERTGLSIAEHQRRTVENYLRLRDAAPDLPIIPVLQGWTLDDYRRCVDRYESVGVDLARAPRVGLGSVCRRQKLGLVEVIVQELASQGVQLHAFGLKLSGITLLGDDLASGDSMGWSYAARRSPPLKGCTSHKNCANCLTYALAWLERLSDRVASRQTRMRLWGTPQESTRPS